MAAGKIHAPPPEYRIPYKAIICPLDSLLLDPCRLAGQVAQVKELGPAHAAFADQLDTLNDRRVEREDTLYAHTVGNFPHGKGGVHAAAAPLKNHAFEI